eukprot:scaffold3418_cov124-Isochrysis_galbana.AAC.25
MPRHGWHTGDGKQAPSAQERLHARSAITRHAATWPNKNRSHAGPGRGQEAVLRGKNAADDQRAPASACWLPAASTDIAHASFLTTNPNRLYTAAECCGSTHISSVCTTPLAPWPRHGEEMAIEMSFCVGIRRLRSASWDGQEK